jgi:D-alanyl-lipoteichoic acid acyltransferase DltB (MBOAT superfamily)
MLFNSLDFVLVFLPIVVGANALFCIHGSSRAARDVLLVASVVFYALSGSAALPVLAGSLLFNFLVARQLGSGGDRTPAQRRWLITGIIGNLVLLGSFKYVRFALDNVAWLTGPVHLPAFVLPLGVSFFTIQQIMYLVDVYEKLATPLSFTDHALFISFFPYISAGPIVRATAVVPQLGDAQRVRGDRLAAGLVLLAMGLVKKVALTGPYGDLADIGFNSAGNVRLIEAWTSAFAYTFQLYFDFSGYTDIALGVALMLGLELPKNFNSPFRSKTVIEFWTRWHMTLSSFITTYLYTPMARATKPLTFRKAMIITLLAMTIAGLWHGAAWTFVVFGLLHGLGIVTNHLWRKRKRKLPPRLAWALTFAFVAIAFVFFRANSIHDALSVVSGMAGLRGFGGFSLSENRMRFVRAAWIAVTIPTIGLPNSNEIAAGFRPSWGRAVVCAAALVMVLVLMNGSGMKGFIYREF